MPYIEIDVQEGRNTDWAVVKVFQAYEESREITRVVCGRPDGTKGLCQVTGWSGQGPVSAYAAQVGDSGEGMVLLVYGGDEGVRLKDGDSIEPWDLDNPGQWGEPCLLLPHDAQAE